MANLTEKALYLRDCSAASLCVLSGMNKVAVHDY